MPTLTKLALFVLVAATLHAQGPVREGMAVIQFNMPLFNETGHRSWELNGAKGIYESQTQIRIEGMRVYQFTGDDANRRIAILTSPEAIFHFDSTTAYGPGELRVKTREFEVSGDDWIWSGNRKEIVLNRNVKVVLFEGVGDILK